ncbi:Efflux transporter periplasmic adaptor subunit [Planctomycetales bacterium 10988]|nr:Efflux transporter periplasmic adaptor subunit [Planctomycetales bacterium 10988]
MIVFLTLLYVGLLFLLKILGVIRFNLAWKLSPIAWFLFLNIALFIPMQWGAPSGPVAVFRNVIEIVPAVSGQVVEVPVEPLKEVKEGETLFQIDPAPFQQEVTRLEAALIDAEQQPALLAANVKIAEATLAKASAEKELADRDLTRSEELVQRDAVSEQEYEDDQRTAVVADRSLEEAKAQLEKAKLEQSALTHDGVNTAVAQAKELLADARYNLDHATVRAPANGTVQQLALRPGARVAALPLRAALVFVDTNRTRISVAINQNQLRYVKPGQKAEVVLKYQPGMTLEAEVVGITPVTSGGQVQSSGVVEDLTPKQLKSEPYQVVLALTDDRLKENDLPGGAVGVAAIYTERVTFTHVIRRVMLRMQAWINYVF